MSEYKFDDTKDPKTGKTKHLHTLNGKPLTGTSEVLKVISKPLTYWAVGEGLKTLGWTPITEYIKGKPRSTDKEARKIAAFAGLERIQDMDEIDFLAALDTAYHAHTKTRDKAAVGGKDLHAELEKYVKFCIAKNEGAPANVQREGIQNFIDWASENVEVFISSEMHSYSEEYWLGGISDCVCRLVNGQTAIIDFKSAKAAYPEMFLQCSGYAIEIAENGGFTPAGERILEPMEIATYIIIPFGAPEFSPEIKHDAGSIREAFLAALTLSRTINNMKL